MCNDVTCSNCTEGAKRDAANMQVCYRVLMEFEGICKANMLRLRCLRDEARPETLSLYPQTTEVSVVHINSNLYNSV